MATSDFQNDILKARCTQNQIQIWDQLLEIRIQLQKVLVESNSLPQYGFEKLSETTADEDDTSRRNFNTVLKTSNGAIRTLLDTLLELQDELLKQNSEIQKSTRQSRHGTNSRTSGGANASDDEVMSDNENASDEEIPSDEAGSLDGDLFDSTDNLSGVENSNAEGGSEDEDSENGETEMATGSAKRRKIDDYENKVKKRYDELAAFKVETIKKWNDRTQVATGNLGKKNYAAFQTPTLSQIDHILKDRVRLIKRTQLKRSVFSVIGKEPVSQPSADSDYDVEIFDDGDFYNQLLRELISSKSSSISDPVQLSQHWLQIQKLRSKLKRKVDTRASKGRKIRYDVHSKLVNFMASYDNSTMSEHAVKELMSSLFGAKKE